jgi:NAD-dependent deacetylase
MPFLFSGNAKFNIFSLHLFMQKTLKKLAGTLNPRLKVAVLTGAGVSAESGIPTFRGNDGLWENARIEEVATPEGFNRNPSKVWEFYRLRQEAMERCLPNPGHKTLAAMQDYFFNFTLITQNIDSLHQKAGSRGVLELHGNIWRARCTKENKLTAYKISKESMPLCACGALLRPDIVWFGEALPHDILEQAWLASQNCEAFISIGTSALVYPAAGLPITAKQKGALLIEINLEPTPLTPICDYSFIGKAGEILPRLFNELQCPLP